MRSPYVFDYYGEFRFDLEPELLWAKLTQTERFGEWWPWMRDMEPAGEPLEPGSIFRFNVVSPLPWRMHLIVEVVESKHPDEIDALVRGDLEGPATLRFDSREDHTLARVEWSVEVRNKAMRVGARMARPLIKWGQDWAVRVALNNFRRHLKAD